MLNLLSLIDSGDLLLSNVIIMMIWYNNRWWMVLVMRSYNFLKALTHLYIGLHVFYTLPSSIIQAMVLEG